MLFCFLAQFSFVPQSPSAFLYADGLACYNEEIVKPKGVA